MRYVVVEQSRSEALRQGYVMDSQVLTRLVPSSTCRGLWQRYMLFGVIKLVGVGVHEHARDHFDL